jgi:hypothetical protein
VPSAFIVRLLVLNLNSLASYVSSRSPYAFANTQSPGEKASATVVVSFLVAGLRCCWAALADAQNLISAGRQKIQPIQIMLCRTKNKT